MSGDPLRRRQALYRGLQRAGIPRLGFLIQSAVLRTRPPLTLGVRVLVADAADRILLVRHSYRRGWYLPGGGVRRWETVAEAAIRETREETGIGITELEGPVGIFANYMPERSDHVVLFRALAWQRLDAGLSLEIAKTGFFPADALPEEATGPTRRRIAEWRTGRPPDTYW